MASSIRQAVEILASQTSTATNTGTTAVRIDRVLGGDVQGMAFVLDVTAAATEASDTLDVFVQTKLDGTNWADVVAFTQVLGNGGAKRYIGKITSSAALTMYEAGTALTVSTVRSLFGEEWRVRWVAVDGGGGADSWTFSVTAVPM